MRAVGITSRLIGNPSRFNQVGFRSSDGRVTDDGVPSRGPYDEAGLARRVWLPRLAG